MTKKREVSHGLKRIQISPDPDIGILSCFIAITILLFIVQFSWYSIGFTHEFQLCHGLGIVDNNELNSYLDYCSHRREHRIWGRKEGKQSTYRKRGLYAWLRSKCFRLLAQMALFVYISDWGIKPSQASVSNLLFQYQIMLAHMAYLVTLRILKCLFWRIWIVKYTIISDQSIQSGH